MNPHTDEVLEGLRPRMKAARVTHVRRMMACLAMVPILGLSAVAMVADEPTFEAAGNGEEALTPPTSTFLTSAMPVATLPTTTTPPATTRPATTVTSRRNHRSRRRC